MSVTALAESSKSLKVACRVLVDSGFGTTFKMASVIIPNVPSEPANLRQARPALETGDLSHGNPDVVPGRVLPVLSRR